MILASFILATTISYAQEVKEIEINKLETDKIASGSFWDNWFISASIGVTSNFITLYDFSNLGQNVDFAFEASLGKWVSPVFGGRIQYRGFQTTTRISADEKYSWNPLTLHADLLINPFNLFGTYSEQRVFDFIPFVGAGITMYDYEKELFLTAGIINRYRYSDVFDFNVEIGASVISNRIVPTTKEIGYVQIPISLTVGATYNFGRNYGRDFERIQSTVDQSAIPYEEMIDNLMIANGQLVDEAEMLAQDINRLKAKSILPYEEAIDYLAQANGELKRSNKRLKEEIDNIQRGSSSTMSAVGSPTANVIYTVIFKVDSYSITSEEYERLEMLASEIRSTGGKYVVEGYVDSKEGAESSQQTLSYNRAKAICDALVNKYGVNPSRVKAVGLGAIDIYGQVKLNRYALVRVVE